MEDKERKDRLFQLWKKFRHYSFEESCIVAIWGDGNFRSFYLDLVQRYSEPHRAYHNLRHIDHCLKEFYAVKNLARNPEQLEMAIWLHDIIYDPHRTNNELRSAHAAVQCSFDYSWLSRLARDLDDLILATKHDVLPADSDAKLLVDIDLAILGQPKEAFDEYERQIRQEYSWVPEEIYRVERAKILQSFLDRPTIYCTEHFQKKYEAQARANLARSIAKLQN